MMPRTYETAPVALEGLRCWLVRRALAGSFQVMSLAARALPTDHPVRIYLSCRIPDVRKTILPATVPASDPRVRNLNLDERLIWVIGSGAIAAQAAATTLDQFPS